MIQQNEHLIRNVQCRLRWFEAETGTVYRDCEWGYEGGKEFLSGTEYAKTEDGRFVPFTSAYAFDGKAVRSLIDDPSKGDLRGGIYGYDPYLFSVPTSPRTLLGYTLDQGGIYTLSELLSGKYVLNRSVRRDSLGGNECVVLEATGFRVKVDTTMYDVRIWLDPKRGYRPVKLEKYESPDDKASLAGVRGKRWELLSWAVDNIELQEIDGVWFPICGEEMTYRTESEFLARGGSEAEFKEKYAGMSDEEVGKAMALVHVPVAPRRRVELKEVKINRGIDPARFSVVFPTGCRVWDSMVGVGYTVGDAGAVLSQGTLRADVAEAPGSSNKEGTEPPPGARASIEDGVDARQSPMTKQGERDVDQPRGFLGVTLIVGLVIVIVVVAILVRARRWM